MSRMFSDHEWKEVREGWAANLAATIEVLELVRNDYKPGSRKRKKIRMAIEREELHMELMLKIIGKLEEMDKTLHQEA